MYQALYRVWRPDVFSDVVGQPHITDTLRAQLEGGRLSHAYLFTGSRGTGKTTCAKILARAVNCEAPRRGDPCNECPSCRGIMEGSVLDVLEIDAASHSGVDNIRALREESVYAPVTVKKRVYIIDEVHMLSAGAFNALLKTLEEPPPHVLFILATTETHKLPATVVSRCQRFAFRRISPPDIAALLLRVARREELSLTPGGASLLARMADGSLRDALSLLDQCAGSPEDRPLDEDRISQTLGLAGVYEMARWAEEMARGDIAGALKTLERLYSGGRDFASLLDELSALLRDLLMARMLGDSGEMRIDRKAALALARHYAPERLLKVLELLSDAQSRLTRSLSRRVETEMCVVRICLLCGAEIPSGGAAPEREPPPAGPPQTGPEPPGRIKDDPPPALPLSAPDIPEPPPNLPPSPSGKADARWLDLLSREVGVAREAMARAVVTVRGDSLLVECDDPFQEGFLRSEAFQKRVKELFPGGVTVARPGGEPTLQQRERLAKLRETLEFE